MKTAEEFASQYQGLSCQGIPKWLIPAIRARDIEVLEEAAKLVCELCRDEVPPKSNKTVLTWHHGESNISGKIDWCYAMDIHDRIAALKKEQAIEITARPPGCSA